MIEASRMGDVRLQGILDILSGGTVEYWSGATPVSTLDTPAGTLLGTVQLLTPAFDPITGGTADVKDTAISNAVSAGTLSFVRWVSSASEVTHIMNVSLSANLDAEILASNLAIAVNDPLQMTGITFG